ncbi:hypothetical protein ATI61_111400 [Archangium gephyra]|uniref:Erythromycin biosynthesis protein CIII-like C-terminal domain-containing protein n=2 Tax=Archangium gephyra TaxID=48 RepID=A0ABX9JTN5_9BACT|nr:macrolide family glycosyltransferase [Archangium gephyra]REG26849.1 hypothetical protein ATI61_111400 [Archangium gephyra]
MSTRTIVVAGMPAAGHIHPTLPVVRELVRRGHRVTYYATEEFRDRLEAVGARFAGYPPGVLGSRDIAEATQTGSSLAVVVRILTATETLLPFLNEQLRAERPAAMMYDSNAPWGRMAATGLGLPRISFMTTFLVGSSGFRQLTAREWLTALRSSLPDLPAVLAARRRLLRRFDRALFPPSPVFPMRGDLTLFPIPRELQSPDPRLDATCRFVGPALDRDARDADLDPELAAHLAGALPSVAVSLGTLHAAGPTFFRTCFDALGDLPVRVVLAVGAGLDPATLGRPPANTLIRATLPQLAVLRRAAVFVTHGGMNSTLEGLGFGLPLVVVPQQLEQLLIARAIADRGAAVVLRHHLSGREVPAMELRAAVDRALTDTGLRSAAEALRTAFTQGGGASAAADEIEHLLAQRSGRATAR